LRIAGIDYSLSSPGICVADADTKFNFESCRFLAIPGNKKLTEPVYGNVRIIQNKGITPVSVDRFIHLAKTTVQFLLDNAVGRVIIEDYAFAARGRVFNIGENCGILKCKLTEAGISYDVISPPVVKKFATDKGNANKDVMHEFFVKETGVDFFKLFGLKETKKLPSPVDDLVDAYYMCKYLHINN